MSKIVVKPEYKEIVDMLNRLTGSRSIWQVFNDWIVMYAIAMQDVFAIGKRFEKNEESYKQIASQYSKEEFEIISEIYSKIIDMAGKNPFQDLLGDLYMQLNMGIKSLGQVFTPYNLSLCMANLINIDEIKSKISKKGYITLNEPTCGGGANVIAFCEYLHKNHINYQTECIIVCQDLSRLAGLMCYVMLSILGCSAVVKIGDTLSDPFTGYYNEIAKGSEIWTTPMFHLNNCYSKV